MSYHTNQQIELQQKELNNYIDLTFKILKKLDDASCQSSIMKGEYESCCQDFFYNNLYLFNLYSKFNDFDDHARKIVKQRYNNLDLYHYTSYESLVSILGTKKLKLNCILNTSDIEEGKILFRNQINSVKNPIFILKNLAKTNFEEELKSLYFFSFTVMPNDASFWERYTKLKNPQNQKSAGGACIQFSKTGLTKLLEKDFKFIDFTPILYTNNDTTIFLEVINRVIEKVSCESSLCPKGKLELFKAYSCSIKREQFKSEREIRLLISIDTDTEKLPDYIEHCIELGQNYIYINLEKISAFKDFSQIISKITLKSNIMNQEERNLIRIQNPDIEIIEI